MFDLSKLFMSGADKAAQGGWGATISKPGELFTQTPQGAFAGVDSGELMRRTGDAMQAASQQMPGAPGAAPSDNPMGAFVHGVQSQASTDRPIAKQSRAFQDWLKQKLAMENDNG